MKFIFLTLFLFFSIYCQAQGGDMATLKKLNATFINNFVTNDTVSHNKIIHKDFICISGKGAIIDRNDYMKGWAHGFSSDVIKYWDYREEFIRIFGTMALIRSMNRYVALKDGKEKEYMSIYTDTYLKENGEWKCVQAQITPVSEENFRGENAVVRKYVY